MDLVIVRENTEGFYADRTMFMGTGEFMPTPDVAIAMRKVTAKGSRRIAKAAFELARTRPRRKVTYVHKANVLKISDALFLKECRAAAKEYPDIATDDQIIDSMTAMLVRDAAALRRDRHHQHVRRHPLGPRLRAVREPGPGRVDQRRRRALHGAGPARLGARHPGPGQGQPVLARALGRDAAGLDRDRRNLPDFRRGAEAINQAVDELVKRPETRTRDLGGQLGTKAFTEKLCAEIERSL